MKKNHEQARIIAKALFEGKSQAEACTLAGLSTYNPSRTCGTNDVQEELAKLEADRTRKETRRDSFTKEPMTLREFQAFLEDRMKDPNNKDAARYTEMYGKTIKAFTDRIQVEEEVSLADILNERMKKRQDDYEEDTDV